MEAMLHRYVDIADEFGCEPTFPITAVTLRRHPEAIRGLSERGVEFAVHGYIHIDHRLLGLEQQQVHFRKAMDVFESCRIPFEGFRGPYLRSNTETLEALGKLGFVYDSSRVMYWNVLDSGRYGKRAWDDYTMLLDFYMAEDADQGLVLPRFENGLVVIPVSMPDDEAMVGRLRIEDRDELSGIWERILQRTHDRGELFTVQLHHERVPICEGALRAVLTMASKCDQPIWLATLAEIAEWWSEKDEFGFETSPEGDGVWRIRANCSERATVLLRNCESDKPTFDWADGYKRVVDRDFHLRCTRRPFVGVARNSSEDAIDLLKREGFVVEVSDQSEDYGTYLDNLVDFTERDEKRVCDAVERSASPLVRYWRWPNGARSAVAVTGDIDSMTLIDFVMRILEVWRQRITGRCF